MSDTLASLYNIYWIWYFWYWKSCVITLKYILVLEYWNVLQSNRKNKEILLVGRISRNHLVKVEFIFFLWLNLEFWPRCKILVFLDLRTEQLELKPDWSIQIMWFHIHYSDVHFNTEELASGTVKVSDTCNISGTFNTIRGAAASRKTIWRRRCVRHHTIFSESGNGVKPLCREFCKFALVPRKVLSEKLICLILCDALL